MEAVMMGKRVMTEPVFSTVRIDDYLPANHLLRAVDALLDTAFVRHIMAPHYSLIGRSSIDPELMMRMLLVGYLGGIRSERKLCAGMHLNLAHRWFCRFGVDDVVPNHSTFSKNRHRRFRDGDVFRAVFEQVVRRCVDVCLVPGENAAVDGSQMDADASRHKRLSGNRVPEAWTTDRKAQSRPVREHLDALDAAVPPGPDEPHHEAPKYLSPTDPAAAWSIKHGVGVFAYETGATHEILCRSCMEFLGYPARSLSMQASFQAAFLRRARTLALVVLSRPTMLSAILRKSARLRAAVRSRTRLSSSRNVTSSTQCRAFSTAQCERIAWPRTASTQQ